MAGPGGVSGSHLPMINSEQSQPYDVEVVGPSRYI
jgi:hypothetical protein